MRSVRILFWLVCALALSPQAASAETFTVSSTQGWQSIPANLTVGQAYTISYVSGNWTVDTRNWPNVGIDGYDETTDQQILAVGPGCKVVSFEPFATLLGMRADGHVDRFVMGPQTWDGSLSLRINDADPCLGDNGGAVTVDVSPVPVPEQRPKPRLRFPFPAGTEVRIGGKGLHGKNFPVIVDDSSGLQYTVPNPGAATALDMIPAGPEHGTGKVPVIPMAAGTVLAVWPQCQVVLVEHSPSLWALYLHLVDIPVTRGQIVKRGPQGKPGSTLGVPTDELPTNCSGVESTAIHVHVALIEVASTDATTGSYVTFRDRQLCGHRVTAPAGEDKPVLLTGLTTQPADEFTVPRRCRLEGSPAPVAIFQPAFPAFSPAARPKVIPVDNHNRLDRLKWKRWGRRVARARGIAQINTCLPDCARGGGETFRVRVRASAIRRCTVSVLDSGSNRTVTRRFYNRVSFTFVGKPPGPPRHRFQWSKTERVPRACR